jgi:proteasome alpha subunit
MGGQADAISGALEEAYTDGLELGEAVRLAVRVLGEHGAAEVRELGPELLEVAVLDRKRPAVRKFRRIPDDRLVALLAG